MKVYVDAGRRRGMVHVAEDGWGWRSWAHLESGHESFIVSPASWY